MADKRYITFVLATHDPEQLAITFQAPKNNTIFNLGTEFCKRHVRLMPAILWYNSFIGFCSIVDDFKYGIEI